MIIHNANATLVTYTSPAVPDARGGSTPGSTTAYADGTRAAIGEPTRGQIISQSNRIAGCTAVIYMSEAGVMAIGGKVTFRMDGASADQTVEVLNWTPWVRDGETRWVLYVKNA